MLQSVAHIQLPEDQLIDSDFKWNVEQMLSARVRMKRQKKANFCSMSMTPAGLKKLATIPVIRKTQMMLPGIADEPWNNLLELRCCQTELTSIL